MSKKLIALVLAVTFAFSFVAKGATVEELQAQIAALLAQIQALQAQLGQQTTTTGACFTMDLKLGMKNDEVKTLQIKLGVTPATGYFGPLTLAAVKKFQAENGIPATGYVGPLTRTALNSKFCAPPPTVPPTTAPTTPITSVAPSYGSLSVQSYPLSSSVTTLYGNNTYEVLAGQYKATGSDITVKKIAVKLTSSSAFPWQYFASMSVWDGSTKLAETAVTQSNLIENSFANSYTLNLSGLNYVIPNGTTKVLTIKVTTVPTIVNTRSFVFTLLNTQTVYTDTAGVTYTNAGSDFDSVTFSVQNANTATITVTPASDNPQEGNIIGATSGTVKADLLKFNVKVDDVNVTLNSATATVTYTGNPQLSSLELWDGSNLVASAAAPTSNGSVEWTNFTLPISAGTTKTLTIKGVLKQLTTGYPGDDTVTVSDPTFHGMDANSNPIDKYATVAGYPQHIYLVAPTFAFINATFTSSGTQTNPQSIGSSKITFTVTANGDDIYIDPNSANTNTKITVANVAATSSKSIAFTCTSNATQSGNYWRITSGSTATCELDTTITLSTADQNGYYQVQVNKVSWATSPSGSWIGQGYGWDNFKTGLTYLAY